MTHDKPTQQRELPKGPFRVYAKSGIDIGICDHDGNRVAPKTVCAMLNSEPEPKPIEGLQRLKAMFADWTACRGKYDLDTDKWLYCPITNETYRLYRKTLTDLGVNLD